VGIASLIIGILGVLMSGIPFSFGGAGIFFGLIAIILGILGRRRLLEEGRSAGVAMGGLIAGILGLLGGLLNLVLCLTICGAAANENAASSGQDWAQQMAQQMDTSAPATPPAMPDTATPGMPGAPTAPAVPEMPAAPTMPTQGGQMVTVGVPMSGVFAPGLPVDGEDRAYIDYTLNVAAPGNYTINLVSPNSAAYDPFLRLLQNGVELEHDDDSGGYPNSRITRQLAPGNYTVRVTSFRRGQIDAPAAFTLTVVGG
jgi:hypothetical protein